MEGADVSGSLPFVITGHNALNRDRDFADQKLDFPRTGVI